MKSGALLTDKAMSQLFERMTYIYGHKWTTLMGDAVDDKGELTLAAKTWQAGLIGITTKQLGKGLERTTISHNAWCPSLPDFRAMCLYRDDVPSVTTLVHVLLKSMRSDENVAKRYQHPIALAIAQDTRFLAYEFRSSSLKQCEAMIQPIYDELLQSGFEDFKPEHYEDQKAIAHQVSTLSPEEAKARFAALKAAIGVFV